uniref:Stomatal closure-related actin-binding protein coiled-coil domain-containing protein n=1 Tax=Aegilops tauschii subsp. strangulata TaxID=200361 RepID=A0A453RT81_AEGTS
MVDILAVLLSKRENELLQQKTEVTRIVTSLKLASEDARRIVDEERTNARMEIENARAAVQRVQKVLQEKENSSQRIGKQQQIFLPKFAFIACLSRCCALTLSSIC